MKNVLVNKNEIEEGDLLVFMVELDPSFNGQILYWQIDGHNVTARDFQENTLIGLAAVMQSQLAASTTVLRDFITEGNESFRIKVFSPGTSKEDILNGSAVVFAISEEITIHDDLSQRLIINDPAPESSPMLLSRAVAEPQDADVLGISAIDYPSNVKGGSVLFDNSAVGTSTVQKNYLVCSNHSSFSFGTGNFTVEFWFLSTAMIGKALQTVWLSTIYGYSLNNQNGLFGTGAGPGFGMHLNRNVPTGTVFNGSTTVSATGPALNRHQWNHIAMVRNNGVLTIYVNGVAGQPVPCALNVSFTTAIHIGATRNEAFPLFNGYISNFRYNKSAVYTENFDVPTSKLTASTDTVLLTCQGPTIVDVSKNKVKVARKDAQVTPFSTTPILANVSPFDTQPLAFKLIEGQNLSIVFQSPSYSNFSVSVPYKIESTSLDASDVAVNTMVASHNIGRYTLINPLVINLLDDYQIESDEPFRVFVYGMNDTVGSVNNGTAVPLFKTPVISATDVVRGAYVPQATVSTTSPLEGSDVVITAKNLNAKNRSNLAWKIITNSKFTNTLFPLGIIGTVPVSIGTITLKIPIGFDDNNTGSETFTVEFYRPGITTQNIDDGTAGTPWFKTATISVKDLVQTATFTAGNRDAAVHEGQTVQFALKTTNIPDGTQLVWKIMSNSMVAGDFASGLIGGTVVNKNSCAIGITPIVDPNFTETAESFALTVFKPGITAAMVADIPPPWTAGFAATHGFKVLASSNSTKGNINVLDSPITFSIRNYSTSIKNGELFTAAFIISNVPNGINVPYVIRQKAGQPNDLALRYVKTIPSSELWADESPNSFGLTHIASAPVVNNNVTISFRIDPTFSTEDVEFSIELYRPGTTNANIKAKTSPAAISTPNIPIFNSINPFVGVVYNGPLNQYGWKRTLIQAARPATGNIEVIGEVCEMYLSSYQKIDIYKDALYRLSGSAYNTVFAGEDTCFIHSYIQDIPKVSKIRCIAAEVNQKPTYAQAKVAHAAAITNSLSSYYGYYRNAADNPNRAIARQFFANEKFTSGMSKAFARAIWADTFTSPPGNTTIIIPRRLRNKQFQFHFFNDDTQKLVLTSPIFNPVSRFINGVAIRYIKQSGSSSGVVLYDEDVPIVAKKSTLFEVFFNVKTGANTPSRYWLKYADKSIPPDGKKFWDYPADPTVFDINSQSWLQPSGSNQSIAVVGGSTFSYNLKFSFYVASNDTVYGGQAANTWPNKFWLRATGSIPGYGENNTSFEISLLESIWDSMNITVVA